MTMPIASSPRPLCAAFAPLLPLISSGALEDDEAAPAREHVAGCAWCQQELARYAAVDEALRREFGVGTHERVLPFLFDLDGDEDVVEDYAFTLEDTLEEPMEDEQSNQRPAATARSSRWETGRRGLSPRVTAITGVAAALILAVIATTIYTKFATPRASSPARTVTAGGAFTKVIKLPNSAAIIRGLTVTSDGSLWFVEDIDLHSKIGRFSPDGKLTEFPVPPPDNAKHAGVGDMTLGPDGNLWFASTSSPNQDYSNFTSSIIRMTPDGAMTALPLPIYVEANRLVVGPDKALWFGEGNKLARVTTNGQFTQYPVVVPEAAPGNGQIANLCVGPDGALWYTWFLSNHIGRMTLDGKAQNFAVPYRASAITSGPDGALWFPEGVPSAQQDQNNYGRKGVIGRMTTSGVYNEVSINPTLVAIEIVAGPDGATWFGAIDQTDSTLKLGRLSASGDVKIYSTSAYGTYGAIVAAPGAIWMLNGGDNTLWRYRLPA